MEKVAHIFGVDPGLVHTGVVGLEFGAGVLRVSEQLVPGLDAAAVAAWIGSAGDAVFVEKYAPRKSLDSDVRMVQGERDLRWALPKAVFLRNMGVRQIITKDMMSALGLWSFRTPSHHQDLRSAARIALLGMVKDEALNRVLADAVRDHLDGKGWRIEHV